MYKKILPIVKTGTLLGIALSAQLSCAADRLHPTQEELSAGRSLLTDLAPVSRMKSFLPHDVTTQLNTELQVDEAAGLNDDGRHRQQYKLASDRLHIGSHIHARYDVSWGFPHNNGAMLVLDIDEPNICVTESMLSETYRGYKLGNTYPAHPFHLSPDAAWPEGLRSAPQFHAYMTDAGLSIGFDFWYVCAKSIVITDSRDPEWKPSESELSR